MDVLKNYFANQDYISEDILHELSYAYDGHEREWRDFTEAVSDDAGFRVEVYGCFEKFFWLRRGYIHLEIEETDEIEIPKEEELNPGEEPND